MNERQGQMIDKLCPNCQEVHPARITRVDGGRRCHEWECSGCGMRWTVKDDQPGETFAFWPADVQAAVSDDE
jgi:hypothetical protein